jgi:hypothetical protein
MTYHDIGGNMVWTQFMDMHSGGGTKESPYQYIYIEAPENQATSVFYSRFGHDPNNVTCSCCGEDYSITQSDSLREATAYERGCGYEGNEYIESARIFGSYTYTYTTLEQYLLQDDILVIPADEIEKHERDAEVHRSGWVWRD